MGVMTIYIESHYGPRRLALPQELGNRPNRLQMGMDAGLSELRQNALACAATSEHYGSHLAAASSKL